MKRTLAAITLLIATTVSDASWRSTGPAGGSVKMIAAAPSNRRVLYVISTGGVFRTTDAGMTWSNITGPLTPPNLVAVDPTDENVAYVASAPLFLFKTSDGGTSWRQLTGGLPTDGGALTAVLIDPRDPRVVYVSKTCIPSEAGPLLDESGVYKSTDGGLTFNLSIHGMQGSQPCVDAMVLDPLHPDTIYSQPFLSTDYARSDDGARSWTHAASVLPGRSVVADPRNDRVRYALGFAGLMTSVMTSVDGGTHWSTISPKLLTSDPATAPSTASVDAATLAVDPAVSRLFFGGSQGLSRSGNGGQTALKIDGPAPAGINSVVFDPVDGALIVGTNETVQRSAFPWTDWITLPTGDKSMPMAEVVASRHDPATAYALSSRLHVTHDYGLSWSPLPADPLPSDSSGVPLIITWFEAGVDETVYARVYDQHDRVARVLKLPAGSTHWIELNPPGGPFGVFVDPQVAGTVYGVADADGNMLVRTRDGGATWETLHLPSGVFAKGLVIDPANSEIIHAITYEGLMRSSDGGHSWKSTLPQESYSTQLTISPADPNTLYANMYDRIYRSIDRGETWSVHGTLPSVFIRALVADPIDPETLYLADNDFGIFRSRDGGATWQSINDGLPTRVTIGIAVSKDGAVLHTPLNGMWEMPLRGVRNRAVR